MEITRDLSNVRCCREKFIQNSFEKSLSIFNAVITMYLFRGGVRKDTYHKSYLPKETFGCDG